jgi:hypothetical protein
MADVRGNLETQAQSLSACIQFSPAIGYGYRLFADKPQPSQRPGAESRIRSTHYGFNSILLTLRRAKIHQIVDQLGDLLRLAINHF